MSIEDLREELRTLDIEVAERIRALEQEYRSLQIGIPIPLGEDYSFAKLNSKWRFLDAEGTPVSDRKRGVRAEFLAVWGIRENFEAAAEAALRAAISSRKGIL